MGKNSAAGKFAAKGFPDGETAASRRRRLAALRFSGAFATLAALAFITAL